MGKGRRYDQEYKDMIIELFKSGMTVTEIGKEYGIANSTINGWINKSKEIKVSDDEVITVSEVMKLKKKEHSHLCGSCRYTVLHLHMPLFCFQVASQTRLYLNTRYSYQT